VPPGPGWALFIIQALPAVTAIIPLFVLFAAMGLVDTLSSVIIIHVGNAVAVATWMMAAYYDTIPIDLEEAAWIDWSPSSSSLAGR
jgi:multiple sugar transport system permease protein